MKGAYICRLDIGAPHLSGVAKKIAAQQASLASAGFASTLFALRAGAAVADDHVLRPASSDAVSRRLAYYRHFWIDIRPGIEKANFLYVRFQGVGPGMLSMLAWLRQRRPDMPIALEIPTYPYRGERRGFRRHLLGLVEDTNVGHLKRYVDRVVTFSGHPEIFGIPTLRTQNGVDVAALPAAQAFSADGKVRLVAVANFGFWHGYDRVIEGLSRLSMQNRERMAVDFIGDGAEMENLISLAKARKVTNSVVFHGPRTGEALNELMSRAHVGLGCLGLHRVYKERSDLKTREYCARGLPFLADRLEKDYDAVSSYVWVCPTDDSPIDLDAVLAWYDGLDVHQATKTLRQHAETHLTWDAKMVPVTEWLAERLGVTTS